MISASNPWPGLNPGKLRKRITIQKAASSQDASGQPLSSWSNVLTCWAEIRLLRANEVAQSGFIASEVSHMVAIRWPGATPLIKPGQRVQYAATSGTVYYQIQAVENPDQRNVFLNLLCLAVNAAE